MSVETRRVRPRMLHFLVLVVMRAHVRLRIVTPMFYYLTFST